MQATKKLVIVTAGSSGIGSAIVRELVKNDYFVVFTYHTNHDLAASLAHSLNQQQTCCWYYPCDVTKAEQIKTVCQKILSEHGTPYALINNAGTAKDRVFTNTSIEEWHHEIAINLHACFYFNHYLLKAMIFAGDGCIVQISSISALRGNIGQTCYSASKAAQIGFTKSLAKEVGLFNLRVNAIAPGLIETSMISTIPQKKMDFIIKNTPLRKTGKPQEVASMVNFLLGKGGEHITGQTLVIDGGLSI